MRLITFFFFLASCLATHVNAQRTTVFFDFAKNTFGDFQDLPSEENLLITGALPPNCELVEISVFDEEVDDDKVLYDGFWTANGTIGNTDFQVPINYKLTPGNDYTFRINYYTPVTGDARVSLYEQVRKNIEAYLNLNYSVKDEKLKLQESPRKLLRELDQIVNQSMSQYRVTSPGAFDGFSDIVLEQLKALDGKGVVGSAGQDPGLKSLMSLMDGELRSMLNQDIVMLRQQRIVNDVQAKDKPGYFSIVGGYGAVYYSGNLDDPKYGDGAFLGLGFPFSANKVAPAILRNASLSVGVYLKDLEIDGRTFTGPVVNKPVFVGLDYKLFSFVRLNAGAVFLEDAANDVGMLQNLDTRVRIRPFIGLSAKLNLTLSLDK